MCLRPLHIREKTYHTEQIVPCGTCPECRAANSGVWSFRSQQQQKITDAHHFVTFTYSDENEPKGEFVSTKTGELITMPCYNNSHVRNFIKSLRENPYIRDNGINLSYLLVGERGETNGRIHHHAIMMFSSPESGYFRSKASFEWLRTYKALLEKYWDYGFTYCDPCTPASIRYVSNYCCKVEVSPFDSQFIKSNNFVPLSEDDRYKYRVHASKNFGFFLEPDITKYVYSCENPMVNIRGKDFGTNIPLPNYYKIKLGLKKEFTPERADELHKEMLALEEQKLHSLYNAYVAKTDSPTSYARFLIDRANAVEEYIHKILPLRRKNITSLKRNYKF